MFVDSMDLIQDDSPDQYHLPFCFLQWNFFEDDSSLSVHHDEYLHIKGMGATLNRRILAHDVAVMMHITSWLLL